MGIDIDNDDSIVRVALKMCRSSHHETIDGAEPFTVVGFRVMKARRQRPADTVANRRFRCGDHAGCAVNCHPPNAGIPVETVRASQRSVGTCTDGIDVISGVNPFDVLLGDRPVRIGRVAISIPSTRPASSASAT